jgi:hypothetical protein
MRPIDFAQHFAVREHAVVVLETIRRHTVALGHGAMMRIVEEQPVMSVRTSVLADAGDERVIVPLVDKNEIGQAEHCIEIQCRRVVAVAAKHRIRTPESRERCFTVFGNEILHAPGIARLVHVYRMPAREQLSADAAQKMCVAVVPVGDERVAENYDAHARASGCGTNGRRADARRSGFMTAA